MQKIIQSNPLPNINQVALFTESDEKCLVEIAEVLKKHNNLDRFGVNLLHQHFAVADDEVMLETNDTIQRTLLMKPVKISEIQNMDARITSWRLDTGKPQMACVCVKDSGGDHGHYSRG